MTDTVLPRRRIVKARAAGQKVDQQDVLELEKALGRLKSMPEHDGKKLAKISPELTVMLDISYEVTELEKDLFF